MTLRKTQQMCDKTSFENSRILEYVTDVYKNQ